MLEIKNLKKTVLYDLEDSLNQNSTYLEDVVPQSRALVLSNI
jgi:hypothetical protein